MNESVLTPLQALGLDGATAAELSGLGDELLPGRVVRIDRGWCTVGTSVGDRRVRLSRTVDLAVGDWVALDGDDALAHVCARRGEIRRLVGARHDEVQVVAANVDVVFVVRPLDLSESLARIRDLLALSYDAGATPVVLLTKSDLAGDPGEFVDSIDSLSPGLEVLVVSAVSGEGVDRVRELCAGRTVVLFGESGAGKSTLINLLLGEEHLATGEVRADGQGRHTTTHRELLGLPGGGAIIDTPGVREVIASSSAAAVDEAFVDVGELAASCRFSDCSHRGEPGCEIAAALADGRLSSERLEAYELAVRDVERLARREDKAAQAAVRQRWRQFARNQRRDAW